MMALRRRAGGVRRPWLSLRGASLAPRALNAPVSGHMIGRFHHRLVRDDGAQGPRYSPMPMNRPRTRAMWLTQMNRPMPTAM
jgi:hypothetical protein